LDEYLVVWVTVVGFVDVEFDLVVRTAWGLHGELAVRSRLEG
jgi:hypothetical protein